MTVEVRSMSSNEGRLEGPMAASSSFAVAPPVPSARAVYVIIGPDGAGKTTIARDVAARLLRRGIRSRISWMRSPRIVTLAVIGLLRLARLAKTVRLGDHDDVHIDLKRHPLLLHLYAWSITFDYFLGYLGKVTVPRRFLRRAIICDRFAWDTLVDLGLTSGLDEGFLALPQGQILLRLATEHGGLLVTASAEELVRRKPILSLDPRLPRRLRLYQELARRYGLGTIDSGNTTESVSFSEAARYFGLAAEGPDAAGGPGSDG
jgi:thymidylate kinase